MYSVFGASGFLGKALVDSLRRDGEQVTVVPRGGGAAGEELGIAFYCIGVTADFRTRPLDAVRAHVGALVDVLHRGQFDLLVYLSSIRVYNRAQSGDETDTCPLLVTDPDDLYGASKLLGESAALASGRPVRIARLANVYAPGDDGPTFLPSVLREARHDGHVKLRSSPDSARDYVRLEDAVALLRAMTAGGAWDLYNVATGRNVTNRAVVEAIARATGCSVKFEDAGRPPVVPPEAAVERIRHDYFVPDARLLQEIGDLVSAVPA